MPVIDAYKDGDLLIPVSNAKTVKAYMCPFTNRVYVEKQKYINHLRDYRDNVIHSKISWNNMNKKITELNNQMSWESVIAWIENNSRFFLERVIVNKQLNSKKMKFRSKFKLKVTYLDIRYSTMVSNTHNAPRNMPTNWWGKDDIPRGYPGWTGQIEFTISNDLSSVSGSDLFENTGIHTGTGGSGGNNKYGYSVNFFEADWPGIEKKRLIDILSDVRHNHFTFGSPYYFRF